jgi:glycerophosphoryl diester phosphodiesterase
VAGVERPTSRPWVIAHRGASAARRENTLDAFREAGRQGADAVELDVRRTADTVPVVHHDDSIPGVGPIVELTAAVLADRAPWVPTLAEALEACDTMWVNAEIKNSPLERGFDPDDTVLALVLDHLHRTDGARRVLISSFNPITAARAVGALEGLRTALLVPAGSDLGAAASDAAAAGHDALHPAGADLASDPGNRIAAVHAQGLAVNTWTVDDPGYIRRLAAAGIDGIVTNRPDAALAALRG